MASALPRLHRAAARGKKGKLKQFLTAGDSVNACDADGRTALLHAVIGDHTSCVEALLAAGADPSASDNDKFFPLYVAAQNKNIAIAKALLRAHANINAVVDRPEGATALGKAASRGDKSMVKLLLDAACDTQKTAPDGQHPLAIASAEGHADVVTMLLAAGADVHAMGADGSTALLLGAEKGSCDVVKRLLGAGANVNSSCAHGRTALHMAACRGFDEVVNILIAAGADVDQADDMLRTPLNAAACCGRPKCAFALLRAGANVSARDCQGASPLHLAAGGGHTDVIEILLSAGAHGDVNYEDNLNRTPLNGASAIADAKAAVNLLLDAGADVNQRNSLGRTALFEAADVKIVKALLDRGANAKHLDNYGSTVLHSAGYQGRSVGVICALFKAGADPTVKSRSGKTAADLARSEGHEDAAKLLNLLEAKHRAMNSASPQLVVPEDEKGSGNTGAMIVKLETVLGKTAADTARREGHEDAAEVLDLLAAKHRSMNTGETESGIGGTLTNKVLSFVFLLAAVMVAFFLLRGDGMVG